MFFFQSCLIVTLLSCFFKKTVSERYYVDSTVSGGTGASWSSPFQFLDDALEAIQDSNSSNEIWITIGTYYPQSTNRSTCFIVPDNTYIYGGFSGNETSTDERISTDSITEMTILDGDINTLGDNEDNCYHVVEISSGLLDSVVIRNGNANKDGDGLETEQVGAAIYVGVSNVNLTLNNVQIINNTAHLGAGIYGVDDDNYVKIYDSVFKNNIATAGTYLGGYGGAINVLRYFDMVIEDTVFINNVAVYRGGAIYQDYAAIVSCENCLFINNEATAGHGGAWFAENRNAQLSTTTVTIVDSNFTSNYAFGYGGACTFFTQPNVVLKNCSFDSNIAGSRGGAITLYEVTNLTLVGNEFNNNNATDSSTNDFYNDTFPEFTYISTNSSYNLSNYLSSLWENRMVTANYNDDLPEPEQSDLCYVKSCQNCTEVILNGSSSDGSSWDLAYSNIQDCIDKLSSIDSLDKEIWVATGIYNPTEALPFVDAITFPYFYSFIMTENIRMYGGFNGTETSRSQRNWYLNPTILSCDMGDIQCTIIMYAADNVTVDGFIFTGALYNSTKDMAGEAPSGNSSTSSSSGTHSTLTAEITDTSGGRGGGIFSNGTNIVVVNSIFYRNLATKGGGLYCIGYAGDMNTTQSPIIINVAFINNYAERGGALMGDVFCNFDCDSCLFEDNYSSEKGGAIYLDYSCNVEINDSVFVGNVAYESGGCMANDGFSLAYLNNVIFTDNEAKWEGGCLYAGSHYSWSGDVIFLEDTVFENNTAYYGFDDIWVWYHNGVYVEETIEPNVTEPTTTTFNTTFEVTTFNTTFEETPYNTTFEETPYNTTESAASTTVVLTVEPVNTTVGNTVEPVNTTVGITVEPVNTTTIVVTTTAPKTTDGEEESQAAIFKKPNIIFFSVFFIVFYL